MAWLPSIGIGLFAAIVIAWLVLLSVRLRSLRESLDRASKRDTDNDRLRSSRTDDAIAGFREDLVKVHRDMRSLDRKVDDAQTSRPTVALPRTEPSQHLAAKSEHAPRYSSEQRLSSSAMDERKEDNEAEILADYNRLAASFDTAGRESFVRAYSPVTAEFRDSMFRPSESGNFWLIAGDDDTVALVIPIAKVARDWEKLYRPMNGLAAQEAFRAVFSMAPGSQLKVERAARATVASDHAVLKEQGAISGI